MLCYEYMNEADNHGLNLWFMKVHVLFFSISISLSDAFLKFYMIFVL